MANELRNETGITLDGTTYTMRASFEAICAIERDLRTNLVPLVTRLSNGDFGVNQASLIIFHGLRGYGDEALTLKEVGELVLKTGLGTISTEVVDFLSRAMQGAELGKSPVAPETANQ